METEHKISAAQFFILMFVSRAAVTIALGAEYTGSGNPLDSIVSYLLSLGVGAVLSLPVWGLHRRYPELDVGSAARLGLGRLGSLVALLYFLYLVLVNAASLALFEIFLLDTVNPGVSVGFVLGAAVLTALYGACRGLETVARCGACVFVVMLLGTALVFGIVAGRFRAENLEPLFYRGWEPALQGTALFLARTSLFADMAILLPQVKGRKAAGFFCWMGGTAVFLGAVLLLLAGCLGRYAATQNFPVYALASMTEVQALQRCDAVFIGIWIMGLTVKLACDLYACRVCVSALLGRRIKGKAAAAFLSAAAAAVLALALAAVAVHRLQEIVLDTGVLFCCTAALGFCVPLLVLAAGVIRRKGEKR